MADVPDKQDGGPIRDDDSSRNWSEMDELFDGGAASSAAGSGELPEGAPSAPDTRSPSDDGNERESVDAGGVPEISQDDIDVLLQAAGGTVPPAVDATGFVDALGSPLDDMDSANSESVDTNQAAQPAPTSPEFANPPLTETFDLEELNAAIGGPVDPKRVTMLNDVNLNVKIELGRTRMLVEDVLKLGEGSVVELDKLAGDPVDIYVNGRLIARGEVLVLNDNFCVRISEVLSNDPHRVSA